MDKERKTIRLRAGEPLDLVRAAALLRDGGLVAFPTETVYGLGANALSRAAVAKIFEAKGRPAWDPLIVHVSDEKMLQQVASVSEGARGLMNAFWPGPLTLLLPRLPHVPDAVTAGRSLVGIRMPRHAVALALIREAGVPLAAPSANRFGHTSPTSAAHVLDDLEGRIDAVLDGGETEIGVESTVVELAGEGVILYRPGAVTMSMLEFVVGAGNVRMYRGTAATDQPIASLPSPGVGMRHYAPRARLVLVQVDHLDVASKKGSLISAVGHALALDEAVGVMLPDRWSCNSESRLFSWGPWDAPAVLAHRLFAGLRALDETGVATIVCPVPQGEGLAAAVRDRLEKAARAK